MMEKKVPVIYEYLDFVKYLRDYYDARHDGDRWFSYRYIQNKTGIDPGYLYKIFQGTKPLPQKKIPALSKVLGLSKREQEYFTQLVLYAKAKSNEDIKLHFEKLLAFREVPARTLIAEEYEYYNKWYYAAIRQILSVITFKDDYAGLARMTVPAITPAQAKKAVTLLGKLGLVKKRNDGVFEVSDTYLTTGKEWHSLAVRDFQRDSIGLAQKALDTVPKEERDISTVTMTLSKEGFDEARERIRHFRREMLELVNVQGVPAGVYHLNVQIIPIGRLTQGPEL